MLATGQAHKNTQNAKKNLSHNYKTQKLKIDQIIVQFLSLKPKKKMIAVKANIANIKNKPNRPMAIYISSSFIFSTAEFSRTILWC